MEKVILEVSYNCNFSCVMCGFGQKPVKPEHFMSRSLFEHVLACLPEETKTIRLNGRGESTIHPSFAEFLTLARDRHPLAAIELFTNLSWRDPRITRSLAETGAQLFISMDSPDRQELEQIRRGCRFEQFMANLEAVSRFAATPFLVFTIQHSNLHRIRDMAEFAHARGLGLIFNTVRSDVPDDRLVRRVIGRFPDVRQDFAQVLDVFRQRPGRCQVPEQIQGVRLDLPGAAPTSGRSRRCPAVEREICVCFNGDVFPCNMFNPFLLGNLDGQPFERLLRGSRCEEFLSRREELGYCRNCAWMS